MKREEGCGAAASVVLLLVPRGLWRLEVTGRLGGVVTIDGTKDGLSGVPIVVRSKQLLGGSRTIETGDDGSYLFQSLPPEPMNSKPRSKGLRRLSSAASSWWRASSPRSMWCCMSADHRNEKSLRSATRS